MTGGTPPTTIPQPSFAIFPAGDCRQSRYNFHANGSGNIFVRVPLAFRRHHWRGLRNRRAPCPHEAGTAPRLGAAGRRDPGGKHESGGAEPRTQRGTTRALVRDGDGTAASLIGRQHSGGDTSLMVGQDEGDPGLGDGSK